MRKVMRLYLEKADFQVEEVEVGQQALKMIDSRPPDLLVLDLMLPGVSEEEVCQQLRNKSQLPHSNGYNQEKAGRSAE